MYIFNFHQNYTREYVPDLIPCMVDTASLKGELLFHAKLLHAVTMFEPSVSLHRFEALHDSCPLGRCSTLSK